MLNKRNSLVFVLVFLTLLVGCLPAPPNQAPVITSTPVTDADVGVPYTYNVNATDPDVGDTLTYTLDIKPFNMSISSTTGLINWIPAVPGQFNVVVKVSDGDLDITQSFIITVIEEEEPGYTPTPPVNHAPVITTSPVTEAVMGVAYTYDVEATDPDGNTLTYSLAVKPFGMGINSANGVIDWIPTAEGAFAVEVKVSDGALSDTQNFTITVKTVAITKIVVLPETMTLVTMQGFEAIQSVTAHYDIKSDFEIPVPFGDCTYVDNPPIATVSNDGVITAGLPGTATITVSYAGMTDTVEVTVVKPVHNITQDLYYMLIQVAIDGAGPGDIIEVEEGTYNETVELKVTTASDISIIGQDKTTTFITGGICFATDYSGLKVQNFTIRGNGFLLTETYEATVSCHWFGHYAVTNLELSDCIFDGENYDDGKGGRCGIVIKRLGGVVKFVNNEFKNYPGWATLDVNDGSGGGALTVTSYTLTNNNFLDNGGGCALRGDPGDHTDTVNVTGNTFDGPAYWTAFEINNAENVEICDNEIRNVVECSWGEGQAIQLWQIGVANIYENIIENNYQGIAIVNYPVPYDVSGISIYHNSFSGNNQYALSVEDGLIGLPLDATDNWWGSEYGPTHNGFPLDGGDAVSDNVDYSNWSLIPN